MELLGWVVASFFAPPGEVLWKELQGGTLEEALSELKGAPVALPHPPFPALQEAYTALFVTNPQGVPAPPYAGYAKDGGSSWAPPTTAFWSFTGRGASRSRRAGGTSSTTWPLWARPSPFWLPPAPTLRKGWPGSFFSPGSPALAKR